MDVGQFITEWGGSIAAAIAIFALIWKSQQYWIWSIVNAVLWLILFAHDLPMLAGLQVSYIIFSVYGLYMWAGPTKYRFGYNHKLLADNIGTVIALGIFAYTIVAYSSLKGYAWTAWWYVEFLGVFISIIANWMDAFKFKGNWILWTMTNMLFGPLFYHSHLWGPFIMTFLYQAFCIWGYIQWTRDEKRLIREGKVEIAEGVRTSETPVAA